ncbi:hypothetical protein K458DRAFT_390890 [Lentithecium fluviatile CBS 122367]|uniref:Alpha/beta-hydrolase n=1 Tax=Lentithecium fluviatile CBS 122367 TaxID=1168545 RepID=A0A6G1IWA7_9PLEO|nr:hypothetical protein K458DRAFT_390890 [Lentithecium fluviatile CBS 122367]
MQNILDPLSQAFQSWTGLFSNETSSTMDSLTHLSSYRVLNTSGITNPAFTHSPARKASSTPVPKTTSNSPNSSNFMRRDSNTFATSIGGTKEVSDSFDIYSKLCVPVGEEKTKELTSVQFLTHGAEKGYATFSYDRLGAEKSARPDPWQIKLRGDKIGGMTFKKVVGVGHSLGSALTRGVSGKHPDDFDAVILTSHSGFSEGGGTVFAKEFRTRQPNALGETLTLGSIYLPTTYTKHVFILNGRQDYFYCKGDCLAEGGDVTADALKLFYPQRNVERSEAVTVEDAGHNVGLHLGRGGGLWGDGSLGGGSGDRALAVEVMWSCPVA